MVSPKAKKLFFLTQLKKDILSAFTYLDRFNSIISVYEDLVALCTNGSEGIGKVGATFRCWKSSFEIRISDYPSIFMTEAYTL